MAVGEKTLFLLSLLLLSLPAGFAAGNDAVAAQALQNSATLVSNTYTCGGGIRCEAIFTITAAQQKTLTSGNDILISFEDKNKNTLATPPFTYDYSVGTMQTVDHTILNWTSCLGTGTPTNTTPCAPVQQTIQQQEIVYHGQYLKQGVNYIRLWSTDIPPNTFVDWQILMKNVPVSANGVDSNVDFDTHTKGWAIWQTTPAGTYYESNGQSGATTQSYTDVIGSKIVTNMSNLAIVNITTFSGVSATNTYVLNSSHHIICKWSFGAQTNCTLPYAGIYLVLVGSDGGSYTRNYQSVSGLFPINGTVMQWTADSYASCTSYSVGEQCSITANSTIYIENVKSITFQKVVGNFTPRYQRQILINWNSTQSAAPSQVTNKSIMVMVSNSTFNNTANPDFGDVRVKMVNTTNNDTGWNYKLTWINGTNANITFTVNSNSGGVFNTQQLYYLVWGNNTNGATTSNSSLSTDFASAPTNWTFGQLLNYSEGGLSSNIANETDGRAAIFAGITSSAISASYTAVYDRQVYIRIANGSQYKGRFDLFVTSGSKRWAFNYDQNNTSGFPTFVNITPVFYVWQKANMSASSITSDVSSYINSTN